MGDLSFRLGLSTALNSRAAIFPAPAPATRTAPYRAAVYGHSFMEWGMDISGAPNVLDSATVNPILKKHASDLTTRVGGTQRGTPGWIGALSKGRFVVPYHLNRAVAGRTGQQLADPAAGSFFSELLAAVDAERAAGRTIDVLFLDALTNDMASTQGAAAIYGYQKDIISAFVSRGIKVVLSTILPRGSDAYPGPRIDGTGNTAAGIDRRPICTAVNAMLLDQLPNEPGFAGMVAVADARALFASTAAGARANDVNDDDTLDGLHPSGRSGLRKLAEAFLEAARTILPQQVGSDLPATAADPANFLGSAGWFQGSGGNVFVRGSAAANTGFAMNGRATGTAADPNVPAGWTVATVSGSNAWSGTDPANVKGTVALRTEDAAFGRALVVDVDCNSAGKTEELYSCAIEATIPVVLPDSLAVGEPFEALMRFEVLSPLGFRGVDVELRITEPDGVLRTVRAFQVYPAGARRTWEDGRGYQGAGALVVRTPPRFRKAGLYGAVSLAGLVHFEPMRGQIRGVVKISQATVKRAATS